MTRRQSIRDEAAVWVMRREDPSWTAASQEELDRWLEKSDRHRVAFWRLEHGWRQADAIVQPGHTLPRRNPVRAIAAFAAAAAAILFIAIVSVESVRAPFFGEALRPEARYETGIGDHKVVILPDGSRLELKTDTAVRVAARKSERRIWLDRGEAYFEVVGGVGRKFSVLADSYLVSVVGTKFSVRHDSRETVVTVSEGSVQITRKDGDIEPITLEAGAVATVHGKSAFAVEKSAGSVGQQLAWREGVLVFNDNTLEEIAVQFNRYNRKQLVVLSARTARMRMGGRFEARNVEDFARLLEETYGLDIQVGPQEIKVSG